MRVRGLGLRRCRSGQTGRQSHSDVFLESIGRGGSALCPVGQDRPADAPFLPVPPDLVGAPWRVEGRGGDTVCLVVTRVIDDDDLIDVPR